MRRARLWSKWATAWLSALLMSACAGAPRDASLPISDPNEQANRQVLAANQKILGPVSEGVRAAIPGPVHDRLHDLNSNLKEPRILVNNVLQLRFDAAARTATRFIVNSTIGIGGLFYVAGSNGIAQQSGDFGQTLFVWGVSEGSVRGAALFGPRDNARCGRICRGHGRQSGRLARRDANSLSDHASSRNCWHHKPGCDRPAGPIEDGRRCFHRFLQLYPLGLLSGAAGGAARSPRAPERRRVTGDQ